MSKIGNAPILVPTGVTVEITEPAVTVVGKEGRLIIEMPRVLKIEKADDKLVVSRKDESKKTKSLHGLYRQLVYNAVTGVLKPWQKRLEVFGTGYNVKSQGEDLVFKIGYSHPVVFKKVEGIKFQTEGSNKVAVSGVDKQLVGQVAFQIKLIKKPDVYKGKGIRYEGEKLRIKPGKKAKTAGAPGAA